MEDRAAPALLDPRQRRTPILHADRRAAPFAWPPPAAGQLEDEAAVVALAAHDLARAQLDARVGRELLAPRRVEGVRRAAVLTEQAADPLSGAVALLASTTSVRWRARPSTSAALRPAAPPPTTMQSQSMWQGWRATAEFAKVLCHAGKGIRGADRRPRAAAAAGAAQRARPDAAAGGRGREHRRLDAQPARVGEAPARARPHPGSGVGARRQRRRAARYTASRGPAHPQPRVRTRA